MAENAHKKTKRPYQKPAIIFSKRIEVLSVVCDSERQGFSNCKLVGTCARART